MKKPLPRKIRTWTETEDKFLQENLNKMDFSELCQQLGRGTRAVHLHLHQHRLGKKSHIQASRNMLIKALNMRFVNYRWFMPDKEFYALAGISQKRFNACLKGQNKLLNDELIKINAVLQLSNDELLECRQLDIFE